MPTQLPYTYTDGQNHRLTFGSALDGHRAPRVSVRAENPAYGGDVACVWLTVSEARALDSRLSARAGYETTDHTHDMLTVTVADDFTVFEVTRAGTEGDEDASVRVVTLTAFVRQLQKALADAVEEAERRALAARDIGARGAPSACHLCVVVKPNPDALRDHMLNVHPDKFEAWRDRDHRPTPAEAPTAEEGRRVLTENEYNRAWHAVEGAAGEEGADPATVLHAVLRVLNIATPPTTA